MTVLKNTVVAEENGDPAYKPFDWDELGRCMKSTILNMGVGTALACALDVPLCLTVVYTDCVCQQLL